MKSWKPKYYIVYPMLLVDQIEWPEGCAYRCAANLPSMLKQLLNTKSIGAEIKLIWNDNHRRIIMEKNNVTSEDIDNYVRADCCMLSFLSERTRKRAAKLLTELGGKGFIYVNSYGDLILQQAYHYKNKRFKNNEI
ncbi:hypothetical protein [Parabacteroides sp. PF5-9]|uniref:hypothetical protein n=1 Tax=Parabacteroides sp. PF5-9 TaxID=1742404 RepID=UPI002475C691|nr:hypothetical protein [Parabacteroides sp. PF5-9]MDH6358953.1 hypothetical protein [Parabacteroides sp. PF5-9]